MTEQVCTAVGEYKDYQTEPCTCGSTECPDYEMEPEGEKWDMVQMPDGVDRYVLTDINIITDGVTGKQITECHDWSTKFCCPVCPTGSIPHYNKHCPDCGAAVAINSKYVKSKIESRRKK
jgi:hypothetical protein